MTLIMGLFVTSPCAGGCGGTVATVPRYMSAGFCVGCNRARWGVGEAAAPSVAGRSRPGRLVDRRSWELDAAATKAAARAPRARGEARSPSGLDALPRTFWALAHRPGAVARVRPFDVWRVASEKDNRPAGWSLQWRAGVALDGRATYWWRWDGGGRWTPAGSRAVLDRARGV